MSIYGGPDIITNGLVLYLDAGDIKSYPGSGNTWYDLSGQTNNCTLVGPTFDNEYFGNFIFNNNYGYINNIAPFEFGTNDFSMEIWFKPTTINNWHSLISKGASGVVGYSMTISGNYPAGHISLDLQATSNTHYGSINTMVQENNIYNVFMSCNRNSTGKIFINGELKYEPDISGQSGAINSGNVMYIGNGGWPSYGKIYIVRIYNRALNLIEVRQNYNSQKSRYGL